MIAQRQFEDIRLTDWYNVGTNEEDCISTGGCGFVDIFVINWETARNG